MTTVFLILLTKRRKSDTIIMLNKYYEKKLAGNCSSLQAKFQKNDYPLFVRPKQQQKQEKPCYIYAIVLYPCITMITHIN